MSYIINVSKSYEIPGACGQQSNAHLFATADHSIQTKMQLAKVHAALTKAFPEEQGFKITVMEKATTGTPVEGYDFD